MKNEATKVNPVRIVNIMIGYGSSRFVISGEMDEKILATILHMPSAVAAKRVGKSAECET